MHNSQEPLSALLIPVSGGALLLPSAALAEMIPFTEPEALDDDLPDWLLGQISWRDQTIPVVSFERANGEPLPEGRETARLAIMNRVSENEDVRFYALVVQGIPHPLSIKPTDVTSRDKQPGAFEKACVVVQGSPAVIPDLDKIEAQIHTLSMVCS